MKDPHLAVNDQDAQQQFTCHVGTGMVNTGAAMWMIKIKSLLVCWDLGCDQNRKPSYGVNSS